MPPVPPKPPKRGILKGPRSSVSSTQSRQSNSHNLSTDNTAELIKNTLQNELITYENVSSKLTTDNHHTEEVKTRKSNIFFQIDSNFFVFPLFVVVMHQVIDRAIYKSIHSTHGCLEYGSKPTTILMCLKVKRITICLKLHKCKMKQKQKLIESTKICCSHEMSLSPHYNLWFN